MLTLEQYIDQQIALGRRIHEQDGVFWENVYPQYCKPAFIYRAFEPGEARPKRRHSLLGYSHQVRTPERGNRMVAFMVLDGEALRTFNIMQIALKKRPKIRKGLNCCEVRLIEDIETLLERIREINIEQSLRQAEGAGSEIPVRRYTEEADAWRMQVRKESALKGREWWGAFVDGVLAAYMRTYQVEEVRVIEQTKSDTAFFKQYPVDALYYTVLEVASKELTCECIMNGCPQHESLNHYKEQFLFRAVEIPYYSTNARFVELVKNGLPLWMHRK